MKAKVSVVILNWNGKEIITECVQSVLDQTYKNIELIIVDNGSTDGSMELATRLLENRDIPWKTRVMNTNVGFAAGMNVGIQLATGCYVLLLNEDVVLGKEYLATALKVFESNNRIGSVGGKVYKLIDGIRTTIIDGCGSLILNRFMTTRIKPTDIDSFTFGVSGSCPVFRMSTLEDVRFPNGQIFDESYFAYFEDMDLFFRCQLFGWKTYYMPDMMAWHVRSASMGGASRTHQKPDFFQTHVYKNRYMTMFKNLPLRIALKKLHYLLIAEVAIVMFLLIKNPKSIVNLVKAYGYLWENFEEILNKRRFVQLQKRVDSSYLESFFVRF